MPCTQAEKSNNTSAEKEANMVNEHDKQTEEGNSSHTCNNSAQTQKEMQSEIAIREDKIKDQDLPQTDKCGKAKQRKNRELNKLEDTPIMQSRLRSESGKVYSSTVTVDAHHTPATSLDILQEEAEMCSKDCCKKSDKIIAMIAKLQTSIDDITSQYTSQQNLQLATSARVDDLEDETKKHDAQIDGLHSELNDARFQIKLITNIVSKQEQQISFLSKKIVDIQKREMAANVVINGIPEQKGEKPLQLFNNFVTTQLELSELIPANKAYRIGTGKNRPLIVELRDGEHKRKLFAGATNLKGKRNDKGGYFFLSEHLPEQLSEERRRANELFSENKKKPASFQLEMDLKKGSLKINQEPYKKAVEVPTIKNIVRPSDSLYDKVEEIDIIKGAEDFQANSKFASFAVAVNDFDEINSAYLKLRMKYADATHISCAYRLPGANTPINQDYVDDGEIGCGRTILRCVREKGLMNVAVFIMRYYGGTHLGQQRFDIFRSLTEEAIRQLLQTRQKRGEELTPLPHNLQVPSAPEGWGEIVEDWNATPQAGKKTD